MRLMAVMMVILVGVFIHDASAGQDATTFYVQLVRGTEKNEPPVPGCKQVGPRLAGTFCPVLKWKCYWELNRQQVAVVHGRKTRVRLGSGREAEIDLGNPQERRVTAFQDGKLVDRTISPAGEAMTIIGGNRDRKSMWFIVVRRDKPQD